jgi:hypothetical protein
MCTLVLNAYSVGEPLEYKISCDAYKVATAFVEKLAAEQQWPEHSVVRLDLWEDEAPLVIRMSNFYGATTETCARYRAWRDGAPAPQEETEETAVDPVADQNQTPENPA